MFRPCRLLLVPTGVLLGLSACSWYVTDQMVFEATDRDGDGFAAVQAGGEDCDDTDRAVSPKAGEVCSDGIDNDCDGQVDDFGEGGITWYLDEDGDGYGTELATRTARPDHLEGQGWAPRAGDCDDSSPQINPGVEDADCDGNDEDCDGVADDDAPTTTWYRDVDSDGYGDPVGSITDCTRPSGYVDTPGDCADTDPLVHPGAIDLCDEVDQDCDGAVDEDLACYADLDGDLHGDGGDLLFDCDCGSLGRVPTADDCYDQDPITFDGAGEQCDGRDNDCDGLTDEAADLCFRGCGHHGGRNPTRRPSSTG